MLNKLVFYCINNNQASDSKTHLKQMRQRIEHQVLMFIKTISFIKHELCYL